MADTIAEPAIEASKRRCKSANVDRAGPGGVDLGISAGGGAVQASYRANELRAPSPVRCAPMTAAWTGSHISH